MKLFKKPKSKFYWYDFTVRGRRYRASTQETKSVKAVKIASLKLASHPRGLLAFDPGGCSGGSAKGRGFAYSTQVDPSCGT